MLFTGKSRWVADRGMFGSHGPPRTHGGRGMLTVLAAEKQFKTATRESKKTKAIRKIPDIQQSETRLVWSNPSMGKDNSLGESPLKSV